MSIVIVGVLFQSTPSVGRATIPKRAKWELAELISIHALRGEGDCQMRAIVEGLVEFQSTPSVGRATRMLP